MRQSADIHHAAPRLLNSIVVLIVLNLPLGLGIGGWIHSCLSKSDHNFSGDDRGLILRSAQGSLSLTYLKRAEVVE